MKHLSEGYMSFCTEITAGNPSEIDPIGLIAKRLDMHKDEVLNVIAFSLIGSPEVDCHLVGMKMLEKLKTSDVDHIQISASAYYDAMSSLSYEELTAEST